MRERDGYYSWTSPKDGREYGLGRDRRAAVQQAIEANAHLAAGKPTLLQRIAGTARSWDNWCVEFEKLLAERDAKPNTVRTRKSQMVRLRRSFSGPAAKVGTLEVSNVLKAMKGEGKHRAAQAFRSFLIDCFDRMIAQGWRADNPARVTDKVRVKVKRARLPLTALMALYRTTSVRWLRNAIALALVAGKDRDSVRNAQFADFRDGGWWNERNKTEARVFLPLELRLQCLDMSLDDVLRQCRSTGIVSRYLVHQTERAKGATLGRPIHPDMITRKFSAELAKLKFDWGGKEPPTFHEIRSLAARLYKQQGDINPQDLLSHKDPRSTAMYTDGRGEWVTLRVPK
jgi:hypothetical protein